MTATDKVEGEGRERKTWVERESLQLEVNRETVMDILMQHIRDVTIDGQTVGLISGLEIFRKYYLSAADRAENSKCQNLAQSTKDCGNNFIIIFIPLFF